MTEPNVLGNVSGAKFIWDSGNTEVITLWDGTAYNGTYSMHHPSSGSLTGVDYVVPSSRVFYLLCLQKMMGNSTYDDVGFLKGTTTNSTTGATCLWYGDHTVSMKEDKQATGYDVGYLKFNAGDYVIRHAFSGSDMFWTAWGVECDA